MGKRENEIISFSFSVLLFASLHPSVLALKIWSEIMNSTKNKIEPIWTTIDEKTTYPIYIGTNIIPEFGTLFKEHLPRCSQALLVTNQTIEEVHAAKIAQISESLADIGVDLIVEAIPEGERTKSYWGLGMLYDFFAEHQLDRQSVIIAMGGGVIGDLAGFAASTFLRGLPLVHIPTTLIAQADSSLGGKVAINLARVKNIVGGFYHPKMICIDASFLQTLNARELRAGLAEVVKYAVIMDSELFNYLEANVENIIAKDPDVLEKLVRRCCEHKIAVVEEDPEERTDRRAILNYGHTIGHALESLYHRYLHGEAVSVGMVAASYLAVKTEILPHADAERQLELLSRIGLPTDALGVSIDPLLQPMLHDKKRRGNTLRFVLPTKIGDITIKDVPKNDLPDLLQYLVEKQIFSPSEEATATEEG